MELTKISWHAEKLDSPRENQEKQEKIESNPQKFQKFKLSNSDHKTSRLTMFKKIRQAWKQKMDTAKSEDF